MKIRILGCSGGIGGAMLRTTSILVDDDILIDCGTGVADLSLDELSRIDHVFLTHSHLDHIASLPLLVDSVGDRRERPLTVYALPATAQALRKHIFNWIIWPDFTEIPSAEKPWLRFQSIETGLAVELSGRQVLPLPADHTVPAVAYGIDSGYASLVFSGDTGPSPVLWQAVNSIENLKVLIIETAFPDREYRIAQASRHLCPSLLVAELRQLHSCPDIYITHLKPGQAEQTMAEIESSAGNFRPRMLLNNQVFDL